MINCSYEPDKVIYNFSVEKLTKREKSVFCKGLKFAIPPNKLEYADFMLLFEIFPLILRATIYQFFRVVTLNQKF